MSLDPFLHMRAGSGYETAQYRPEGLDTQVPSMGMTTDEAMATIGSIKVV